jgi:hypothetical protein
MIICSIKSPALLGCQSCIIVNFYLQRYFLFIFVGEERKRIWFHG